MLVQAYGWIWALGGTLAFVLVAATAVSVWFLPKLKSEYPRLYADLGSPTPVYFLWGSWLGFSRFARWLLTGARFPQHAPPDLRYAALVLRVLLSIAVFTWIVGVSAFLYSSWRSRQ